ncbi:MAG: hypothetical protein ACJ8BW_36060 [Ktedonobacteraceae bacterium]
MVQVDELPNKNHRQTYKVPHWVTLDHSYTFIQAKGAGLTAVVSTRAILCYAMSGELPIMHLGHF